MKLSVLICTYNREKYLIPLLESIINNDFPRDRYEIVLVDNNSSDATASTCQCFADAHPDVEFHYFFEPKQGLSHARNRCVAESRGDILIYVDDDALVNELFLQTYWDFFTSHPDVAAAGGPVIPRYESAAPKWMSHYTLNLITGYAYFGDKEGKYRGKSYPCGGNAAYRKEVFEKVGLFNPNLGRNGASLGGSEEKDIFDKMRSLGMEFYYLPTAILYHLIGDNKLTDDYFNRLTLGIGQSERRRALDVSKSKYLKRLISEGVKWCATIVLLIGYTFALTPVKGVKLVQFRRNVTKGLLNIN